MSSMPRSTGPGAAARTPSWSTYTPANVAREIAWRLGLYRPRPTVTPAPASSNATTPTDYDGRHAIAVGRFYDAYHEQFMAVYGPVIQAFRTRNVSDLLDAQIASMTLRAGQRVVDAGCGVAAPAIHFATHAGVEVDAITISRVQHDAALRAVEAAGLRDRVHLVHGDYHRMPEYLDGRAVDVVYFLESFGHSRAKPMLIDACWKVLRPGGTLYVKDLFRRVPLEPGHADRIEREIRRIDEAYHYEVADLNTVLDEVRRRGFQLASLKTVDVRLTDFEDLAISNRFQELTGLAPIQDWDEYVFPVDFFELTCVKPEFDLATRLDRHYVQTQYHRHRAGDDGAA